MPPIQKKERERERERERKSGKKEKSYPGYCYLHNSDSLARFTAHFSMG
jgi:hypothetical protein